MSEVIVPASEFYLVKRAPTPSKVGMIALPETGRPLFAYNRGKVLAVGPDADDDFEGEVILFDPSLAHHGIDPDDESLVMVPGKAILGHIEDF